VKTDLHISGVLPTMSDRTVLARDTLAKLSEGFGDLVLPEIPRRVVFGEAHAAGVDIFGYEPDGEMAQLYADLVREVMARG
jgi:cellulose biosynthesis protein BcsQ